MLGLQEASHEVELTAVLPLLSDPYDAFSRQIEVCEMRRLIQRKAVCAEHGRIDQVSCAVFRFPFKIGLTSAQSILRNGRYLFVGSVFG